MSWLDTLEDIRSKDFSKVSPAKRDEAARNVINMASYACAVVAVSPIPFSDAVLMLPVQTAMVASVGHIYGRKVTDADARQLMVELAATLGIGMLARQGIKAILPVLGALLTVPAAFAMNWGIGRVAMEYFRDPQLPRDQLKKIFESARQEGLKMFSKERFEMFRRSKAAPVPETPPQPPKTKSKPTKKAPKKALSPVEKAVTVELPKRLHAHRDVREAFNGIVHLELSGAGGGKWTADLTKHDEWITKGLEGTPALTLRTSGPTFLKMLKGTQNPQMAMMNGTLELEPMDLDLAMKLGPLFG